jgi:hypothetical protein
MNCSPRRREQGSKPAGLEIERGNNLSYQKYDHGMVEPWESHSRARVYSKEIIMSSILRAVCAFIEVQKADLAAALITSYETEEKGGYKVADQQLRALGASASSAYIKQLRMGWINYCAEDKAHLKDEDMTEVKSHAIFIILRLIANA